jgi:hypothetical protein
MLTGKLRLSSAFGNWKVRRKCSANMFVGNFHVRRDYPSFKLICDIRVRVPTSLTARKKNDFLLLLHHCRRRLCKYHFWLPVVNLICISFIQPSNQTTGTTYWNSYCSHHVFGRLFMSCLEHLQRDARYVNIAIKFILLHANRDKHLMQVYQVRAHPSRIEILHESNNPIEELKTPTLPHKFESRSLTFNTSPRKIPSSFSAFGSPSKKARRM